MIYAFVQVEKANHRVHAFVLDTYSRKVVGWSMANNPKTELVLDAVNMAIYARRPQPGPIHHPDRGSQYTSVEFGGA